MTRQRHNWFPCPMFADPATPTNMLDCTVHKWGSATRPGIILKSTSSTIGGYVMWKVTGLPAGAKCAFSASCGYAEHSDQFRGPLLSVCDSSDALFANSKDWGNDERIRVGFTVPSDGAVGLIFRGRVGKDTAFYSIICTEAGSDESFFHGSTMPLNTN